MCDYYFYLGRHGQVSLGELRLIHLEHADVHFQAVWCPVVTWLPAIGRLWTMHGRARKLPIESI
jgi:hypothetical protein